MEKFPKVIEKFEYNGWPSISRPDFKPPAGWSISLITAQNRYRNHKISPDGKSLAVICDTEANSDVYTIPLDGGWPARITTDREQVAYWDDEIPQWSPDGQYLAFSVGGHVQIVRHPGGMPKTITDFTTGAWGPRWFPDSNHLVVSTSRFDADQLLLTDRDGAWPRALTNSPLGDHWEARPSPDGQSVLFIFRRFDDLHRLDVCVIDLPTNQIRTIYGKPGVRTRDARWSPNGEWITFISQDAGHDDLWLAGKDGQGLQRLTDTGYDISQYAWSPDGKHMLVTINHGGCIDLAFLNLGPNTIDPLRTTRGVHSNPNWSNDGSFITFEYESPIQAPEIFSMQFESRAIRQHTFAALPSLKGKTLVMPDCISYPSFDGLEIPAFLFRPDKPNGAAILCPHGGPSAQYSLEWDILTQYLLAKGYTVMAPNYRGSTGYGLDFEHANYGQWGVGDTQDCLFGGRYLGSLSEIDASRLAILGGSYGGYLTNCCLARDPDYVFACGIAKYGDADTLNSWALCKRELRLYTEIFLGHPAKNRDIYLKSSPIFDVANVRKPILLLHGLDDDVVPPESSEEWAQALKAHNKTYEYKTYSHEGHGFFRREDLVDAYSRIERFLDWYLLPR